MFAYRSDGMLRYRPADRMSAIDHLDLVVTSLQRSLDFYRGLLEPLGYVRLSEIEGERGERVVYLGRIGGMGSVSLREAQSAPDPVPYDRYTVGLHHLAFSASSRAAVDERSAWLREQGATIESGPEEYDYTPGYYAVFFYDPDAIKLEIVHRSGEADLVAEVRRLTARLEHLERQRG
jgi:glyoxylase I family protein